MAGSLERRQPHNEFLATRREFGNFELRLQYKVEGTNGFVNGGVQFWSQRVPNNFEVSGYQADLGAEAQKPAKRDLGPQLTTDEAVG